MVSLSVSLLFVVLSVCSLSDNHESVYYKQWCSENSNKAGYCEYLDDTECQKYFPNPVNYDRDFMCPNLYDSSYLDGYTSTTTVDKIIVDSSALIPYTSSDFYITVILIRRDLNNKPYYKYLSNGNERIVYQPWSSTKPFAIINAGSTQRNNCIPNNLGLDSYEDNKSDELGDLSTIIHSYDESQGMESNCLAFYFNNIGGRQKLDDTIHSWLGSSSSESLGGNYGCSDTYNLGMTFTSLYNDSDKCSLPVTRDVTIPNALSTLSSAEFYKRIIMTREEPQNAYPNIGWNDTREMLYGPENSKLFPGILWGGATTDTSIYLQSGLNTKNNTIEDIDQRTNGRWRIFSKLGAGISSSSFPPYQITNNAYGCFPYYDNNNNIIKNKGIEFVMSIRQATIEGDLCYTDNIVHNNVVPVVQAIVNGTLA